MTNVCKALLNILKQPNNQLKETFKSGTKVNRMGDSLEEYIKNCFADTFDQTDKEKNVEIHSKIFSWQGTQNNPPDLILKGSDAIEVKKIGGFGSIALNSSYPKAKLKSSSSMITNECRACENDDEWEKELVYALGTVNKKNIIKVLFFIYGSLYAAGDEIYSRIKNNIADGVEKTPNVVFSKTNELGRVNSVDPLGITQLRIRGMWQIYHPYRVYDYLYEVDKESDKIDDYIIYSFIPNDQIEKMSDDFSELEKRKNVNIYDKKIKNPNNPSKLIDIKLIKIVINY